MRVFLSYSWAQSTFVHRVNYHLRRQSDLEPYCYAECEEFGPWDELILKKLEDAERFVLFCSPCFLEDDVQKSCRGIGRTQRLEVLKFYQGHKGRLAKEAFLAILKDAPPTDNAERLGESDEEHRNTVALYGNAHRWWGENTSLPEALTRDSCGQMEEAARECARAIAGAFLTGDLNWVEDDGLPHGYPFEYEKDIIEAYVQKGGFLLSPERLEQGCPMVWPQVEKLARRQDRSEISAQEPSSATDFENPLPETRIGGYRPEDARIIVDARSCYHRPQTCGGGGSSGSSGSVCLMQSGLCLLEAGPRRRLLFDPAERLRVGIVVSGGIAPGINAVINAIVERHHLYYEMACKCGGKNYAIGEPRLWFVLYRDGLTGLLEDRKDNLSVNEARGTAVRQADVGGSWIGTSRFDPLLDLRSRVKRDAWLNEAVKCLAADRIDILYVIGGDGSMRAAHAIATRAKQQGRRISVVGIPKTMDNDILWVWQAFGFLSAVERARQAFAQLQTEVMSNPRLCVIQLFGSDSGFVVSHTALASGTCDGVLIPEVGFRLRSLSKHVRRNLQIRFLEDERAYGTILLAETAIPIDAEEYTDNPRYEEVDLEEEEKEAIRRFLGSSRLSASDVRESDWADFCTKTGSLEGFRLPSFETRIWAGLPDEIRAVVRAVAGGQAREQWDRKALQASVLRALNHWIEAEDLLCDGTVGDSELPTGGGLLRFLKGKIEEIQSAPSASQEKARALAELLRLGIVGLSLPYEITVIRKRLEDFSRAQAKQLPDEIDRHVCRAMQILREKLNRLILEAVYNTQERTIIQPAPSEECDGRVHGQTPDALRSGGLKLVSRVLRVDIERGEELEKGPSLDAFKRYCKSFRVFTNEPRHLLRALDPSVSDVVFGQRLGILAVDNAMAGFTDFMVSQWLTEYVLVPLPLTVLGRKRVPREGIFWKSVIAKTGQPGDMLMRL
ncbi:MAG: 6-phosphofructokinase [Planctomycetes bacterium]|nr:6-phosphofructokinase [Planctomycetota bacterium]